MGMGFSWKESFHFIRLELCLHSEKYRFSSVLDLCDSIGDGLWGW